MGENVLATWADQVGIVANRVVNDKTGWDFLLELPPVQPRSQTGGALDREAEPTKCLVQVKSTDSATPRVRASIASLRYLVTASLPAFVLILDFQREAQPVRASMLHMAAGLGQDILTRIRQLSHLPQPEKELRRRKFTLPLKAGDLLPSLDGMGLESALRLHVGADFHAYIRRKQYWLQSVGYERGGRSLQLNVRVPETHAEPARLLVDFALGLEPELEVVRVEMSDVRFGVPAPERILLSDAPGKLRYIRHADRNSEVRLKRRFQPPIKVAGKLRAPADFVESLPSDAIRVRFMSEHLDLVFSPLTAGVAEFRARLPGSDEASCLVDLRGCIAALHMVTRPDVTPADPVNLSIVLDGVDWLSASVDTPAQLDDDALRRIDVVRHVWSVAKYCDIPSDAVVTFGELILQEHAFRILHELLSEDSARPKIEIAWRPDIPQNEEICIPIATAVTIGEYTCIFAHAVFGRFSTNAADATGDRLVRLSRDRVVMWKLYVLPRGTSAPMTRDAMLSRIADTCSSSGFVFRWWDGHPRGAA